ncbi:hypothetical protein BDZ88DRAFT_416584 [Geranomyces variabilis]|nr:hypothetical protein BDZ88DRAFT_416584 [Geranomyces variabilis]KAJ3142664.1 hypothetical protein HDU90_002531 [Geranomyces variabilis]
MSFLPRLHLLEFHEQPWVPATIRHSVARILTAFWVVQPAQLPSPLRRLFTHLGYLSPSLCVLPPIRRAVQTCGATCVIDCCAGSGGPTPVIERAYNNDTTTTTSTSTRTNVVAKSAARTDFYMTDLFPDVVAWKRAAGDRATLKYVESSVDATDPPAAVRDMKAFRAFFLSFHHFDDALAKRVVKSAMKGDGFGVFELQSRTFTSLLSLVMLFPFTMLVTLITPSLRTSLSHLFFTFVVPIVPLIVMVDGFTSALRTRTSAEILHMVNEAREELGQHERDWEIEVGEAMVLKPANKAHWVTVARVTKSVTK